jgi:hypothetical protein
MKYVTSILTILCVSVCIVHADDTNRMSGAQTFLRQVVQSLIDGEGKVTFPVADKVFATDNGEVLSKTDFQNVWPQLAKEATKKNVSSDQFFRDVDLRIDSPLNNKRLMSNKRMLESYKHQDGDLYCDASHVKEGVGNFIAYDKAFIYVIRKVEGKWTLIGIGG